MASAEEGDRAPVGAAVADILVEVVGAHHTLEEAGVEAVGDTPVVAAAAHRMLPVAGEHHMLVAAAGAAAHHMLPVAGELHMLLGVVGAAEPRMPQVAVVVHRVLPTVAVVRILQFMPRLLAEQPFIRRPRPHVPRQ